MIRVVVADDQAVVRDGLVLLLSATGEVEVVGAAADGEQAVELSRSARPDVALLDLRMPKLTGDEVTAVLARELPALALDFQPNPVHAGIYAAETSAFACRRSTDSLKLLAAAAPTWLRWTSTTSGSRGSAGATSSA